MPFCENRGARIFYDDVGDGPLVIALHGMMSPGYWTITGAAGVLGLNYRVAAFDMRGHGRTTVPKGDEGFDAGTIAGDIGALADHLGVRRFHLLAHATGGMAAIRYAVGNHDRLLSLLLMDTSAESASIPQEVFDKQADRIASTPRKILYDMLISSNTGVGLTRLHKLPGKEWARDQVRAMFAANDPAILGEFMRSFFPNSDSRIEGLKGIGCPTLAAAGEYDPDFIEPIRKIAGAIPGADLRILPGLGHMTAFEDINFTIKLIKDFLDGVESRCR
jgi:pimeloyl-ACP methyl ester carboxylesterase